MQDILKMSNSYESRNWFTYFFGRSNKCFRTVTIYCFWWSSGLPSSFAIIDYLSSHQVTQRVASRPLSTSQLPSILLVLDRSSSAFSVFESPFEQLFDHRIRFSSWGCITKHLVSHKIFAVIMTQFRCLRALVPDESKRSCLLEERGITWNLYGYKSGFALNS